MKIKLLASALLSLTVLSVDGIKADKSDPGIPVNVTFVNRQSTSPTDNVSVTANNSTTDYQTPGGVVTNPIVSLSTGSTLDDISATIYKGNNTIQACSKTVDTPSNAIEIKITTINMGGATSDNCVIQWQ